MHTWLSFEWLRPGNQHGILTGTLPVDLVLHEVGFQQLWDMHPPDFHVIKIHGRLVPIPRWQQAYGQDYQFSGTCSVAVPEVPPILRHLLEWASSAIEARLNGILVNWYEGQKGHYIGAHRDSTARMIEGAPIVTISFGDRRIFRLRPWKGAGLVDVPVDNGSVIVIPYITNKHWTHEVPHSRTGTGRRISVTLRAFLE